MSQSLKVGAVGAEETDFVRPPKRPVSEPRLNQTVGLELLEAWPMKCAYAVQEVFNTERDYIVALSDIIQGYRNPLTRFLKAGNEGHRVISTIFSNVEELYNLHRELLESLQYHHADPHGFGQVFVVAEEKFRVYCVYCTNYDAAIECLQVETRNSKDLTTFFTQCQYNLEHTLPLSSQLIKPVQRIMRYHIMLKEVLKHFDLNHHGYRSLESAYNAMLRVGNYINEVKKRKENQERIMDLQSHLTGWTDKNVPNLSAYGEIILEATCKVGHRAIPRQVILFDKLLLILKKKESKKYTYKGHILTSELHIDGKFSEQNPTMFRVSSLLHKSQSYVVDLGGARKQQDWLNKMHGVVRKFLDQAKRGRLVPMKPTQDNNKVKRRKLVDEDVDMDVGSGIENIVPDKKSMSVKAGRSSRASRLMSSKRRSRGDVRELFPDGREAPLSKYTVDNTSSSSEPSTATTSCPATMQTITESGESQPSSSLHLQSSVPEKVTTSSIPKTLQPTTASPQHHRVEPDSTFETRPQHSSLPRSKSMSSATSEDSLVSLGDVKVGMMEGTGEKEEEPSRQERKMKLTRRAAIKVKRSKTISVTDSSGSYSSIIKARAQQAREASKSPTPTPQDLPSMQEEDESEDQSSHLLPLLGAPSSKLDRASLSSSYTEDSSLTSYSSMDPQTRALLSPPPALHPHSGTADLQPPTSDLQPETSDVDLELSFEKVSPFKRPRSQSHDQETMSAEEPLIQVEIVDEDELELGESCGQAKLRGRVDMPALSPELVPAASTSAVGHQETTADMEASAISHDIMQHRGGEDRVCDDSGSVEDARFEDGSDFMIVEDSSDSEGEESAEELEVGGSELELNILEAAEMGEEILSQQQEEQLEYDKSWAPDEDVPTDERDISDFFSALNSNAPASSASSTSSHQQASTDSTKSSVFQFEGSVSSNSSAKSIQLYGTLPHRKKSKSTAERPLKSPPLITRTPKKSVGSLQDNSRSTVRRAEGFSRLLEFTRQQVELESSAPSADFDVTQSLPVHRPPAVTSALVETETENSALNGTPALLAESEGSQVSQDITANREDDEILPVPGESEVSGVRGESDTVMEEEGEKSGNGLDASRLEQQLASSMAPLESVNPEVLSLSQGSVEDTQPCPSDAITLPPPPSIRVTPPPSEEDISNLEQSVTEPEVLPEPSISAKAEPVPKSTPPAAIETEPQQTEATLAGESLNSKTEILAETTQPMTSETQPLLSNQTEAGFARSAGLYGTLGLLWQYLPSRAVLVPLVVGVTAVALFYSIGGYFSR